MAAREMNQLHSIDMEQKSQPLYQGFKLLLGPSVKFGAEAVNYPRTFNLILNYFKDVLCLTR